MARKKKEFNKNGTFQRRFTDLWYKSGKTQEQLANDLGVTRPTVVGWSDGKNLPDIESLERITRLFDVSADYLLGLSDTMMPDISLRAAMEYTGLSEEAVNSLHNGFTAHNSLVINSEEHRNKKLQAASDLLQSGAFRAMLDRLIDFSQMAHLISLMEAMLDQYWDYEPSENGESFSFARKEDRENILTAMQCVQQKGRLFQESPVEEIAKSMNDKELIEYLGNASFDLREELDLRQFLVSKEFNGYVVGIIKKSRREVSRSYKE